MERTCQKCNQPVSQEAFLCPHCGAILDTATPKVEEVKQKRVRKIPYRHILSVIVALLLVASVVILVGSILKWVAPNNSDPTYQPTVPTTTESAPLVAYEVKVRTDNRKNLQGIWVELCKDGEVLYSCEAGNYGTATFILPQAEGYTIRLSKMPQPYEMLYCTTEFPFAPGQQNLEILLQTEKVPYVVKVVNREGEPLPDTRIYFYGYSNSTSAITDQYGTCVFEDKYVDAGYQAGIESYPTGYYAMQWLYNFEEGSVELTIVLDRYEDVELPSGYSLYKVRVVDEFGEPMAGLYTVVYQDQWLKDYGYTNSDGVAVFKARDEEGQNFAVAFPKEVDHSHLSFAFTEGSRELEIVLKTQNTTGTYTYQIHVHDQYVNPVAGVEIAYQLPDGTISYYTSDENGDIFMELTEADPTKVTVWLHQAPEGYEIPDSSKRYTFDPYSRVMPVVVYLTKSTQVTIKVVDENGEPMPGVILAIRNGNIPSEETHVATGPNGTVNLAVDPMTYYEVWIYVIPNGYSSDTPPQYINAESGEVIFVLQSL